MKIRKIKIHNVKGISEYCVDALLLPNRPNILVAPNGFGKSSIATAFASIASGGINLSEDDAHNNDLANLPRVEIELTDGNHADELQPQCMEIWQVAEVSCNCDSDMLLHVFEDIIIEEPQIFYSHSDHLGSASWITDMTGTPVQYIHYMPYGELLVYQTLTDYDERFKFTGKERDDENGYLVISPFALPATATHSEWRWIDKKSKSQVFSQVKYLRVSYKSCIFAPKF